MTRLVLAVVLLAVAGCGGTESTSADAPRLPDGCALVVPSAGTPEVECAFSVPDASAFCVNLCGGTPVATADTATRCTCPGGY